jgi:hypothetical protein
MNNADTPAQPFQEVLPPEGLITNWTNHKGFSKREELSARFAAALLPVYLDTVEQYESSEAMVKCWAESSVEFADALIKQWEK